MKIKRRTWILAIVATATVGFTLLAGARRIDATSVGKEAPNGVEIKIDNFSFTPMTVTVAVGTTVTWTNDDDVPHTVVSDDTKTFKSRALDTGDRFSYTFTKPGKYSYFCSVHPRMTAEVVVL
jgi:plastocyanin